MMRATSDSSIDCGSCDAACCRLQVLLIGDNGVPERFVEWSDWGGQVLRRLADGWCAGLDRTTLRCTIYAQRPQVCRDFEKGGGECIEERCCSLDRAG
jgi:Fe-S-cluster containining protein